MPTYTFHIYSADVLYYNSGTGNFDFEAGYDYTEDRYRIDVTDDDSVMDSGGDFNQTATVYDMDGNVVDSGIIIVPAYVGIGGGSGAWLDRVEVNGTHYGYVSTSPLTPGTSYSVGTSGTYEEDHTYYQTYSTTACFGPGTLIEGKDGTRPIERLSPGDLVRTLDHGLQPVRWAGCWAPKPATDKAVQVTASLPGNGKPRRPLTISAQHRVLLSGPWFELNAHAAQVLAPASALEPTRQVGLPARWYHLLLPGHEIIRANGIWVESLFAGGAVFRSMPPATQIIARAALGTLAGHRRTARPCLTGRETRLFFAEQGQTRTLTPA